MPQTVAIAPDPRPTQVIRYQRMAGVATSYSRSNLQTIQCYWATGLLGYWGEFFAASVTRANSKQEKFIPVAR